MNATTFGTGWIVLSLGLAALWAPSLSQHQAETPVTPGSTEGPGVRWRTDLASAMEEATRTRRPLLAVFR